MILGGDFLDAERKKRMIAAMIGLCMLFLIFGFIYAYEKNENSKNPKIIKPDEVKNAETVKKKLDVSSDNAAGITREITRIESGQKVPTVTYYISAPDVDTAAKETASAIKNNDERLPKVATEKTDRTVVTPDSNNQKVDVYKINLKKPHKIKVGMLQTTDHTYYGAGYQAGKWEGMVYTRTGKKVEAGTISYTIKEW